MDRGGLDVPSIADDQLEMSFQHGIDRPPVDAGAFHADMRHPRRRGLVPQGLEVSRHRAERAHLLRRSIPGRADQKTRNNRLLVHVPSAAPLNNHPRHRLLPPEGDRDAAGASRHCHACSPFPGATKNGASMRRGPDCLSGSQTTAEVFSLEAIARAKTGINQPASPPFSLIVVRRRRSLAA